MFSSPKIAPLVPGRVGADCPRCARVEASGLRAPTLHALPKQEVQALGGPLGSADSPGPSAKRPFGSWCGLER